MVREVAGFVQGKKIQTTKSLGSLYNKLLSEKPLKMNSTLGVPYHYNNVPYHFD